MIGIALNIPQAPHLAVGPQPDQDLGGDIAFDLNQEPVRRRKEDTEAKDRQRVLPDRTSGRSGFESAAWPVARDVAHEHHRQRQEVDQPEHVEIGFVDRIDDMDHPFRNHRIQHRNVPGHHNQERERDPDERQDQDGARPDQCRNLRGPVEAAPGPEHEQQLPGERVEVPVSSRKRRQIPVEIARQHVKDGRAEQGPARNLDEAPQDAGNASTNAI